VTATVKGCQMPALKHVAMMIPQPYAGRRLTSTKGGNRGMYRCALFMAPVYGDLSSHSVVVHDDQAELPDEYIVQTSYVEADTLVFSLQRRAVNESFAP